MSAWVALLIVIAVSVTALVCVVGLALGALYLLTRRADRTITPLTEREVAQLLRPHAGAVTYSPVAPPVGDNGKGAQDE